MTSIQEKNVLISITYFIRNLLSKPLFDTLDTHLGAVLDIGGGSFYKKLNRENYIKYFVVEPALELLPEIDEKLINVVSNGKLLPFKSNSFDTILLIQVLQFIFEPNELIKEIHRVLRAGGKLILQVPQSGNLHGIPHHYYNFTRFWIEKSLTQNNLNIINHYSLGGSWRTISSRLFLMFWPVFKNDYYLDPLFQKRSLGFYITLPIQIIVSVIFFPITLLLSFFDIKEEANNHLVIAQK